MSISKAREESHEIGFKCTSMVGTDVGNVYIPVFYMAYEVKSDSLEPQPEFTVVEKQKELFDFIEISHCES